MENRLVELSEHELAEINGGGIVPSLLAGLIIAGVVQIISDWDNFKNGIAGRREIK
jgi:bacteriocin-like protein